MLNFGSLHAEKRKSFRRIKDLITLKFHEKMFKVSSTDEYSTLQNNYLISNSLYVILWE